MEISNLGRMQIPTCLQSLISVTIKKLKKIYEPQLNQKQQPLIKGLYPEGKISEQFLRNNLGHTRKSPQSLKKLEEGSVATYFWTLCTKKTSLWVHRKSWCKCSKTRSNSLLSCWKMIILEVIIQSAAIKIVTGHFVEYESETAEKSR